MSRVSFRGEVRPRERRLITSLDSTLEGSTEQYGDGTMNFISCWTVRSSCSSPWVGLSWRLASDGPVPWPEPATCLDPGRQLPARALYTSQPGKRHTHRLIIVSVMQSFRSVRWRQRATCGTAVVAGREALEEELDDEELTELLGFISAAACQIHIKVHGPDEMSVPPKVAKVAYTFWKDAGM